MPSSFKLDQACRYGPPQSLSWQRHLTLPNLFLYLKCPSQTKHYSNLFWGCPGWVNWLQVWDVTIRFHSGQPAVAREFYYSGDVILVLWRFGTAGNSSLSIYIYIGAGVLILLKFKHGLTQRVGLMEELYRNDLNSGSLITTRDLHMYVYICKYTYIHTYTPIHTYTYIYMYIYVHYMFNTYIYIYIFISVAVQMDCP